MAIGDDKKLQQPEEVLAKMVQADYLLDKPCELCDSKEGFCFNFFCLICKVGGLCSTLFNSSASPHFNHDRIQIFKTSYQYVVRDAEMQCYFDTRIIQKYNSNNTKCCYLRTKQSQTRSNPLTLASTSHNQRRSFCQGCSKMFSLPRDVVSNPGIVCSVECLLKFKHPPRQQPAESPRRNRARKQSSPTRSLEPDSKRLHDSN